MPAPPPAIPLLNGDYPDYSRIKLAVGDETEVLGVTELNYSDNCEPGEALGTAQQVLAFTPGQYRAEGSLTLHKRWADILKRMLGNGFMVVQFGITVVYDMNDGRGLITDDLIGCRLKKPSNAHRQGNDPLMEQWDLAILKIRHNGIDPIPRMR